MDDIKEVTEPKPTEGGNKQNPPKLKPKHALFVNHYINTHNASEAVRLSGYKDKEPARTANNLMKRPEIIQEISRREAELQQALIKDKPQFLLDLQDLKRRAKERNRLDTELKAMLLEADILGLTAPEQQQQVNVFSTIDSVKKFLYPEADKAEIIESNPIQTQTNTIPSAEDNTPIATDTISTLSGEVITIEPENRG